ncbi:MAG: hypothetical protein Q4A01_06565 [Coriobacteriales bacterium]|nr:hypothetical protein [Coriobacteriales bacterium]
MRGTNHQGRFWRMLGVTLSGLLVLSVCVTAGYAEQIEVVSEDAVTVEEPVVEVQSTSDEEPIAQTQNDGLTWTKWNETDHLPSALNPDNYRLMVDVNLTDTWDAPPQFQ